MVFPADERRYSFQFDGQKERIVLPLPNDVKKSRRLIYRFEDVQTGECLYVGKTARAFAGRMGDHLFGVNHPGKRGSRSDLYTRIRENPDRVAVITTSFHEHFRSLSAMEKDFIARYNPLFNSDKGGGGGSAKIAKGPQTAALSREEAKTPPCGYRVTEKRGRIGVDFTPRGREKSGVYGFRKRAIAGSPPRWYVGQTARPIRKRASEHISGCKRGKNPLAKAISENPKAFELFILKESSPRSSDAWERAFIEAKNARHGGYNKNRGGGGGTIATPPASPYKSPP